MPKRHPSDRGLSSLRVQKEINGHALAYVYFQNEPGRRAAANLLTKDEARRIALNIASYRTYRRRKDDRPLENRPRARPTAVGGASLR